MSKKTIKIHKISDNTVFKLRTRCGIYPSDESQITDDDSKVTCEKCKRTGDVDIMSETLKRNWI